jgi:hypothetical protein
MCSRHNGKETGIVPSASEAQHDSEQFASQFMLWLLHVLIVVVVVVPGNELPRLRIPETYVKVVFRSNSEIGLQQITPRLFNVSCRGLIAVSPSPAYL